MIRRGYILTWIPSERGRSERVLGQWLAHSGKRHDIVLVSKGGHPDMTGPDPEYA